jgi:hypothetical protein
MPAQQYRSDVQQREDQHSHDYARVHILHRRYGLPKKVAKSRLNEMMTAAAKKSWNKKTALYGQRSDFRCM